MGPLVYRLAFQPLADASVLILFIAAIGVHLAMTGLGLAVFGAEGSRIDPMLAGVVPVGPIVVKMQSLAVLAVDRGGDGRPLRLLRAHAARQGAARDRRQPPRRAARRRARRRARRAIAFALAAGIGALSGVLIGPSDHGRLRHRLPDRPEGLRRGDHRRARELSADRARRARRSACSNPTRPSSPAPSRRSIVFSIIIPFLLWRSYATARPPTTRRSERCASSPRLVALARRRADGGRAAPALHAGLLGHARAATSASRASSPSASCC